MLRRTATAIAVILMAVGPSMAHEFKAGSIEVGHPWSRPTPPSAPVASGYLKLTNTGTEADRLIQVESSFSARAEIHQSVVEEGVAKMRQAEGGIIIEPGGIVDFEAERLHIMFIDPARQLKDKESFPATLVFEKAGRVEVEFAVQRKAGETAPEDHSGHGSGK